MVRLYSWDIKPLSFLRCFYLVVTLVIVKCLVLPTDAKAQSASDLAAMQGSTNYSYSGTRYIVSTPLWTPSGGVLEMAQGRYDYNFEIAKAEYVKLRNLTLVNKTNQKILDDYRRTSDFESKTAMYSSKQDFSRSDVIGYRIQLYTAPYSNESIRSELQLLQAMDRELNRIKRSNPDAFYQSQRYKDLINALVQLKTCNWNEVEGIRIRLGLI